MELEIEEAPAAKRPRISEDPLEKNEINTETIETEEKQADLAMDTEIIEKEKENYLNE